MFLNRQEIPQLAIYNNSYRKADCSLSVADITKGHLMSLHVLLSPHFLVYIFSNCMSMSMGLYASGYFQNFPLNPTELNCAKSYISVNE